MVERDERRHRVAPALVVRPSHALCKYYVGFSPDENNPVRDSGNAHPIFAATARLAGAILAHRDGHCHRLLFNVLICAEHIVDL